jgi:hypothetical protein
MASGRVEAGQAVIAAMMMPVDQLSFVRTSSLRLSKSAIKRSTLVQVSQFSEG